MGGQDDIDKLGAGEQEALISARLGDIRKKVNAESWSPNMEKLIADWGEKAAGLRFMHSHSGSSWKNFGNNLAITGILVTSIASSISLVATSVEDIEIKNGILFGVGGVGMVSALIQSFKKFYNAEEKAADHASVSKQFGSFYRYVTLQMNMSREDRDPSDVLTAYALKEYERLQQEAPPLTGDSIKAFKSKFSNKEQAIPDIAEDKFVIHVTRPPIVPENKITFVKETVKINDVELGNSSD
jgi:hypothetical protein|tara:strand:- start:1122 stop:1847 length:726 start_codon:yes stop_codon:yes gene_type:complete